MSVYYGRKSSTAEYIVVKHQLGLSTNIMGIRYIDGFGVVAKDSKEHKRLKQIRMAVVDEYPITFLTKVKSVINNAQIKAIWGSDVYRCFLQHQTKKEAKPVQLQEVVETPRCSGHKKDGNQCGSMSLKDFDHCRAHIEQDLKIQPFIKDMKTMPSKEKRAFVTEAIQKARE